MGMVGTFTAIPAEMLERFRSNQDSIGEALFPDDGAREPEHHVDVDKAWHGIHYLLTGVAWGGPEPLAWAVLGGEELGPDVGYGPARFLTPSQVQEISTALSRISKEWLASRFNPADMQQQQIYPETIWARDSSEALDYLLEYFQILRNFYSSASTRGDAVVQCLT